MQLKRYHSILALLFIVFAWAACGAWMIVDWPHGDVVGSDRSDNYSSSDFVMPRYFGMVHWDNWQIVLTEPDEVMILLSWIRDVTLGLPYIPERRDCDDFAIMAKGTAGYYGFGNCLGLVIDYTVRHAYNAYWWLSDAGDIVLKKIEPQFPLLPEAFPSDHSGVIYW